MNKCNSIGIQSIADQTNYGLPIAAVIDCRLRNCKRHYETSGIDSVEMTAAARGFVLFCFVTFFFFYFQRLLYFFRQMLIGIPG